MGFIDQLLGIAIQTFGLFLQLLASLFTFFIVAIQGILHAFGMR